MKFCRNCGAQIDEKAVICVKCGVPVSGSNISQDTNVNIQTKKAGNGAATASMVLGIIALIASVITFFISLAIIMYSKDSFEIQVYSAFSSSYDAEKIGLAIGLTFLPGILTLIGLPLGLFCRKGGSKVAGIILNLISLIICIIQVVIIIGM